MTITPTQIKELRDRTNVAIGACKEALKEAGGDMEKAILVLREKGMASAVKKEGRATNEGQINFAETQGRLAIIEVNAETDFVVKNEKFQAFASSLAEEVAQTAPASLEAFLKQSYSKDTSMTIEEYRSSLVQAIGENIQIKRLQIFEKDASHSFGVYSHLGGKILVVVEISGSDKESALAKQLAMHVAAAAPEYLSCEDVPEEVVNQEKAIIKQQIPAGKPEHILEKIIDGKLQSFFDGNCLLRQPFIRDDSLAVGEVVEKRAKEAGTPLKVKRFIRWEVGKGEEK